MSHIVFLLLPPPLSPKCHSSSTFCIIVLYIPHHKLTLASATFIPSLQCWLCLKNPPENLRWSSVFPPWHQTILRPHVKSWTLFCPCAPILFFTISLMAISWLCHIKKKIQCTPGQVFSLFVTFLTSPSYFTFRFNEFVQSKYVLDEIQCIKLLIVELRPHLFARN